ncbi:Niemann-Pick C1 protein [Entamoeba marina]
MLLFLLFTSFVCATVDGGERDVNNLDQYNNKCRMHNVEGCTAPDVNRYPNGTLYLSDAFTAPLNMLDVCITEHPEFDPTVPGTLTCCDEKSVSDLDEQSSLLDGSFGKCPACYLNQMNFWCGFACSPDSARYTRIEDYKYDDTCGESGVYIPTLYYYVAPYYAEAVYNSCRDTELSGGFAVRTLYPSYVEFFQMISDVNPVMPLYFVFDETGYNGSVETEMHLCSDMCSCQTCHETCTEFIEDEPFWIDYPFLGSEINLITLISLHIFLVFIITVLVICGVVLNIKGYKYLKALKKLLLTTYVLVGAITLIGIIFIVIGGIMVPFPMSGVTCDMPWGDGNALGMIFVYIGVSILILGYAAYDSYMLYLYNKLITPNKHTDKLSLLAGVDVSDSSDISGFDEKVEIDITDNFLSTIMEKYALLLWKYKWYIIVSILIFCSFLCIGLYRIVFITDSLGLWVPPNCQTMKDKQYYDDAFGAFFRINQFMLESKLEPGSKVVTQPLIIQLQQMIDEVKAISFDWVDPDTGKTRVITMDDMCYKPIMDQGCIVTSVTGYWQHDISKIMNTENVTKYVENCLGNPLAVGCADDIGAPVDPHNSFGNYSAAGNNDPLDATILQATIMFNQPNDTVIEWAMEWEKIYLEIMNRDYSLVKVSYQAQRSVDDEINRETSMDIITVVCSYVVMFIYISLSLGNSFYNFNYKTIFVKSRILLGISGIAIVLFSVFTSAGFFSWIGVDASVIITEVIPFLVLAIGVDNIFILTNTFDEENQYNSEGEYVHVSVRLSKALRRVGPSMMLASISESLAFFLGYLTSMPAVQSFSLYAGLAIFIDFVLQITVYAVLLCYDCLRQEHHGFDFLPWFVVNDSTLDEEKAYHRGSLLKFGFKYVADFLSIYPVKILLLFLFFAFFVFSLNFLPSTQLGLPQQTALPQDSYMQDYFEALTYLEIGPPVYLVIRDGTDYLNYSTQSVLCASDNFYCDSLSIPNYYDAAEYIDGTTFDWIDDYFSFASLTDCCRIDPVTKERCLYNTTDYETVCDPCFATLNEQSRPLLDDFYKYLPTFLTAEIDEMMCSVNGQAYYPDIVWNHIDVDKNTDYSYVNVSRLRLFHTVLVTQDDFIQSLIQAYNISDYMNSLFDVKTFPYSYHYVYFQQYFDIVNLCFMDISLALGTVFVVVMLLMFDPIIALIIVLCVLMCVVDLVGMMYLWGIELNAVSCVNLVMSVGITIEFCVHIAHAFLSSPKKTMNEKMRDAVMNMGNNVFVGITLTKFLGVIVLALSSGLIFVIYYFRMYFMILVFGASHGLFFLPIMISLVPTFNMKSIKWFALCKKKPKDYEEIGEN